MALYNRILRKTNALMPLRGSTQLVYIKNISNPFAVRLGATDIHVLEEIYLNGEYDPVIKMINRPIKFIVDLGSNTGISVRYWKDKYPKAIIVGVEPSPDNVKIFQKNLDLNYIVNDVNIVQGCIGAICRTVNLDYKGEEWGIKMQEVAEGSGDVNVTTICELLNMFPSISNIDLMKVDIEGAEIELFSECRDWIHMVKNLVIEIHPPYTVNQFLNDYKKSGGGLSLISVSKNSFYPVLFLGEKDCYSTI